MNSMSFARVIGFAIAMIAASLCAALNLNPLLVVPIAAALLTAWTIGRVPREKQLNASIFVVLVALTGIVVWVIFADPLRTVLGN